MTASRVLSVYLNNHRAAAEGGVQLFRRAASSHRGDHAEELHRLADEVREDSRALEELMERLGVRRDLAAMGLAWVGEKAARFKPNGYLVRRSPLSDVIELEGLRIAVHGKLCGWQVLRAVAVHDERIEVTEIERLIVRAEDQQGRLYKLHLQAAQDRLTA